MKSIEKDIEDIKDVATTKAKVRIVSPDEVLDDVSVGSFLLPSGSTVKKSLRKVQRKRHSIRKLRKKKHPEKPKKEKTKTPGKKKRKTTAIPPEMANSE